MTIDRIRELYAAQPFRPFTIHMADGRNVEVPHRDFIALGPQGRTVLVYRPDESHHFVDLLLVTDVHVWPPATSGGGRSSGNGDS